MFYLLICLFHFLLLWRCLPIFVVVVLTVSAHSPTIPRNDWCCCSPKSSGAQFAESYCITSTLNVLNYWSSQQTETYFRFDFFYANLHPKTLICPSLVLPLPVLPSKEASLIQSPKQSVYLMQQPQHQLPISSFEHNLKAEPNEANRFSAKLNQIRINVLQCSWMGYFLLYFIGQR